WARGRRRPSRRLRGRPRRRPSRRRDQRRGHARQGRARRVGRPLASQTGSFDIASSAVDLGNTALRARALPPNPIARLGQAIWDLLTSVNFAVLQIIVLGIGAAIGMTIRQLPGFAFRTASDYAQQMDLIHQRYDPLLGSSVVDVMEHLQVFQVFTSWWFSAGLIVLLISIVCCTLDRTPRLWHQTRDVRVVQPEPYFDPSLPDRAAIPAGLTATAVAGVLRKHHFRVR